MMIKKLIVTVILKYDHNSHLFNLAVKSILNQTLFNFELFIIVNKILNFSISKTKELNDPRIHLISILNYRNKYSALNAGLELARGKYVYIVGSDQPFLHSQLETELNFMEKNKNVGLTGAVIEETYNGNIDKLSFPFNYQKIKVALFKSNCFANSSLIFRRSVLKRYKLIYNDTLEYAAEYDLLVRASQNFQVKNSNRSFLDCSASPIKPPNRKARHQAQQMDSVRLKQLEALNIKASKGNLNLHLKLMKGHNLTFDELQTAREWLNALLLANKKMKIYNSKYLFNSFQKILNEEVNRNHFQRILNRSLTRTDILNLVIKKFNYVTYLEIGVNHPEVNFDHITCETKVGIDPISLREDIICSTSDDYFGQLNKDDMFDIIFIDGLHHNEQLLRDIDNSLKHLSNQGMIVCHDMLPESETMQIVPRISTDWTGDCWKAWAHLRMSFEDLTMIVVDTDYGIGIIRRGHQDLFKPSKHVSQLEYSFFTQHKYKLMNIVDQNQFYASIIK